MLEMHPRSELHSTPPAKPAKPYPDFPLYAHAAGYWAKKIRGKVYYFGSWHDPDAALDKYNAQKDDLHAGHTPRPDAEALTVKAAVNEFLNAKQELVKSGELSPRTWEGYERAGDEVTAAFGKGRLVSDLRPDDFTRLREKMARKWGLCRLGNTVQYVRSLFRYAFEAELIDRPVRFGPLFVKPSKKTFRIERAKTGPKLFTREEIRLLLAAAGTQLQAMILLACNAGFGNADCAMLPLSALDLDGGWINFPRPKTGVERRVPLWQETVEALRAALARRAQPKHAADAQLVFITKHGLAWGKDTSDNPISKETSKLLHALRINGRKGFGFYTIRHIFRTVADEAKDQPAVDHIMGHESPHMSSVYRETISDARLKAVADHVHAWLFPPAKEGQKREKIPQPASTVAELDGGSV
jgi:integrase